MATTTTERRTAVLIVGPDWWGERWRTCDGGHLPLDAPELRDQRRTEAEQEKAGLVAALGDLPGDCVLLLAGDNGATLIAHRWAEPRHRQTVVVPSTDPGSWALALGAITGLATRGWLVKGLVCAVPEGDSPVKQLVEAGVYVRVVAPLVVAEPAAVAPTSD